MGAKVFPSDQSPINIFGPNVPGSPYHIANIINGGEVDYLGGTSKPPVSQTGAAPAAPGGEGEGGEEEFDWSSIDLPPMTYLPTPTGYEQDWMDKFKVGAYAPWARGVVGESYGQLGTNVESIYKRILGEPDTSMFVYPESTIAPLGQLGDIVKGYYKDYKSYALPEWEKNIKPAVAEQYAGPGYWGTARADAVSKSLNDLGGQIGVAESSDVARARQTGLLGQVAARLAVDEGKRNYLAARSNMYKESLTSALTNIEGARSGALNTLLSAEPVTTGAVGAYSRQFVEPKINPEFVAAANWYSSLLGQTAFDTAGWLDKQDTSWSSLLGGLATTLGQGASKYISDLGTKTATTPSFNYTTLPALQGYSNPSAGYDNSYQPYQDYGADITGMSGFTHAPEGGGNAWATGEGSYW